MLAVRVAVALAAAGAVVGATVGAGPVVPVVRVATPASAPAQVASDASITSRDVVAAARVGRGVVRPLAARSVARHHPSRLTNLGTARQVIVVTSPSWGAARGTLRAYERASDGTWHLVVGATPAWLGSGGMVRADQRRQGTGTTPAGTFAIPSGVGRRPDPGTRMPYLQFDRDDAWPYDPADPATYNVFQHEPRWRRWDSGYVEHLWRLRDQYRYVAVLDYNLPPQPYILRDNGVRVAATPADTRRGGGIFLHVDDDRPTAGCIGVSVSTMRTLLRWLDPAAAPVLVAGPHRVIDRM